MSNFSQIDSCSMPIIDVSSKKEINIIPMDSSIDESALVIQREELYKKVSEIMEYCYSSDAAVERIQSRHLLDLIKARLFQYQKKRNSTTL